MKKNGFSLLELLISISAIGALAALTLSVVNVVRHSANRTREITAAHHLIIGYIRAAHDHDGELPPGIARDAEARNDRGETVAGPIAFRYPWRIASYLDQRVDGTLLVNDQSKLLRKKKGREYDYLVSFAPSFGINAKFVGGDFRSSLAPGATAERRYGKFCLTHIAQCERPAMQLVFASSRYSDYANLEYLGHHAIEPPNLRVRNWSLKFDRKEPSALFGYVDPRYDGKAVAAMLDGHVELLDETQLSDMRRWSHQAAAADHPEWTLGLTR